MRLTNYWWLLIWLFTGGVFFAYAFPKRYETVCGRNEARWGWIPAIGLVAPYWMWATFRKNIGDTEVYRSTFLNIPDSGGQIIPYLAESSKDRGFSLFSVLFKTFISHSDLVFFGVIAAVQLFCMVWIFRRYSSHYWESIFLFIVSTDYLSWMHNGMRQFIAVTIIFAAFELLLQKKYIPLILIILIASTIHGSALLMLPVVFIVQGRALNKKTVFVVALMLAAVFAIDRFTPLLEMLLEDTQYSDMMTNEIWMNDNGTNVFRVLVYSVPALMAIFGRKYIWEADDPVINLCVNCSLITMGLYAISSVSSGIYIGRLPIYTTLMGYISLPWLIDHMFVKKSVQIINILMVVCYFSFFYLQMHYGWNMI